MSVVFSHHDKGQEDLPEGILRVGGERWGIIPAATGLKAPGSSPLLLPAVLCGWAGPVCHGLCPGAGYFKVPLAQGIASLWHPCTGSSQAAWSWVVGLLGPRFFTRLMITDAHLRRNLGAENEPLCPVSKILLIVCSVLLVAAGLQKCTNSA